MKFLKDTLKTGEKRVISGIMAVVMFISALSVTGFVTYKKAKDAKAAVVTNDGKYTIPGKNDDKLGTEGNPYVVLEVVPNVSMASFGYLVSGQEPIDVEKAINADSEIAENLGSYVEATQANSVIHREFDNLLTEKQKNDEYQTSTVKANQYGEFVKVGAGEGDYELVEQQIPTDKYIEKNGGEYDRLYESSKPSSSGTFYVVSDSVEIKADENHKSGYVLQNGKYKYVENIADDSTKRYAITFTQKKPGILEIIFGTGDYYKATNNYCYLGSGYGKYTKQLKYRYTLQVKENGNYKFEPFTYDKSMEIYNNSSVVSEYKCFLQDGKWSSDEYTEPLADTSRLKGYMAEIDVWVKYAKGKGYINTDLFKKFGIGLAYKSNDIEKGEDVSKYEFDGWYTEKQCVNKFNVNMRLQKDTTIYAKWIAKYPTDEINEAAGNTNPNDMYIPNYTISFDANTTDTVHSMPSTIEYIEQGKTLVAPSSVPKRNGKIFDGWCTDREGTNKYMFSSAVTSNIVLYAKWIDLDEKTFRLEFDANTPNADDMENVTDMPPVVERYCRNGMTAEFTNAEPLKDPTLNGYTFAGWYYNKACTKSFSFNTTLADNIETDTIRLYAKWVPNNSNVYKLRFDSNVPETAIAEAYTKDFKTELDTGLSGFLVDPDAVSASKPSLEGNITAKVNKYKIEVITVTPEDFTGANKDNNLNLIDRANLIVFNQTVDKRLSDIFPKYKSEVRFGNRSYSYNKTTLGGKNDSIDLSWEATKRIFKKVAIGDDGKGKNIAPIIFDSNIIKNIATSKLNQTTYTTSDNKNITMSDSATNNKGTVSSMNIFKLYLLTQQMNPVTFYNAYISARAGFAEIGDANDSGKGIFRSFGNGDYDSTAIWSFKTLFPVEAVTQADWNTYNNNGDSSGIAQVLGFNDNPLYDYNCVNNRTIVTENILAEFINQKTVTADEDMKDFYADISGKNATSYSYNMIDAIYYLTHAKVAITNFDESLNVLDIEPSSGDGAFKNPSFWFWYISKYIGNFSSNVAVTKKSTWEFVGDIDDLNSKYDLIYIGGNISTLNAKYKGLMPTNSDGKTYTYAHTGAKKTIGISNAGLLEDKSKDSAITEFVASGNDITKKKYDELLAYAEAGYPVVFGRELLDVSTAINGAVKVDDINTKAVDTASYIYKYMKTLISDSKYSDAAFFENQYNAANAKKFREALEVKKFSLSILSMPTEYVDKTLPQYADKKAYINENDPNSKSLKYRFTINSNASRTYTVKVYIDTNADGKFVDEEKLDALEIYDSTINRHVRYNRLTGGHTFDVSRVIEDYVGAIPWKLEIYDNNNKLARNSMTGMCAIKVSEKTKLNILQIVSNKDNKLNLNNLYLPTDAEIASASNNGQNPISRSNWGTYFRGHIKQVNGTNSNGANLTDENILLNSGMFYYFLDQLKEFEVHFDRMTVKEFENKVNEQNAANSTLPDEEKTDFMDNYNMLVLGYADCFSDVNDAACKEINKFINEGNTTLFTHDTTSFFNVDKTLYTQMGMSGTYWGYNINKYFRNILGMDRYDVMTNHGDVSKMKDTCDDKPYKVGGEQSDNNLYKDENNKKVLTQGMTNGVLMGVSGSNLTYTATKANDGQLVSYPYEIPDEFSIAGTHSQYYQLDLEEDDIVVWYSLYGKNSDFYSVKNDVRNNYYIYNKGNITYTGVGHSKAMTETEVKLFANTMIAAYNATVQPTVPVITNADKSTDNKNTDYVYVDYDATVSETESVPFGNGVFNGMEVKKYNGDSINTTTKRIYFTLKNNSIVMNKEMTVHYFPAIYDDATGEFKQLSAFPLPLKTYRIDDESKKNERTHADLVQIGETSITVAEKIFADNDSNTKHTLTGGIVESNEEYYVDVPITDEYYNTIHYGADNRTFKGLDGENEFAIQIQVIMRYGRDQSANTPLKGYRNVLLMRRGMFSLD